MEFNDVLYGRRSVRTYTEQSVSKAEWDELLKAAIIAPSASNSQPWAFGIIENRELLDHLNDSVKAFALAAMATNPTFEQYRRLFEKKDYHIFYRAPALMIIMTKSDTLWAETDCALAAQNVMLAAHAMGLGTCWIGFSQMLLNTPEMKQKLGVPKDYKIVAPMIVGHPKHVPNEKQPYDPAANLPVQGRKLPQMLIHL